MSNAEALAAANRILDRAASTAGPFWEAAPSERAAISELLGAEEITLAVQPDGSVVGMGSHLLGQTLVMEAALAELNEAGVDRDAAIFAIRARVSELLEAE